MASTAGNPSQVWSNLFIAKKQQNLSEQVQDVLRAIQNDRGMLGKIDFAREIAGALETGEPQKVLIGCVALLAASEYGNSMHLNALADEGICASLASSLSSQLPSIVVAAVARTLSVLSALPPATHTKDDRQWRPRRVVTLLQSMLDAHPRDLLVQEALAKSFCVFLSQKQALLGGQAATMWSLLWPLIVHPHVEVAETASLCLCRHTWLVKEQSHHEDSGSGQNSIPNYSEAFDKACAEFCEFFQLLQPAIKQGTVDVSLSVAELQCVRILQFLQYFAVYGKSQSHVLGRAGRSGMSGTLVILPITRIFAVIGSVITTTLHSATSSYKQRTEVFPAALDLLSTVLEVAGSSVLPHSLVLRKWLKLMVEASLPFYVEYSKSIQGLLLMVLQFTPAILLNGQLLEPVVVRLLDAMQSVEKASAETPHLENAKLSRKKRKAQEAFESNLSLRSQEKMTDSLEVTNTAPEFSNHVELFQASCDVLGKVLIHAASVLKSSQIALVCEKIVRMLWFGIMAPLPTAGIDSKLNPASKAYWWLCRDGPSMLPVLEVIQALYQPQSLSITPLAPTLSNGFMGLLDALSTTHRRITASPYQSHTQSRPTAAFVRQKIHEVQRSILAASNFMTSLDSFGMQSPITITWPEPSDNVAEVRPSAVPPDVDASTQTSLLNTPNVSVPTRTCGLSEATTDVASPASMIVTKVHDTSRTAENLSSAIGTETCSITTLEVEMNTRPEHHGEVPKSSSPSNIHKNGLPMNGLFISEKPSVDARELPPPEENKRAVETSANRPNIEMLPVVKSNLKSLTSTTDQLVESPQCTQTDKIAPTEAGYLDEDEFSPVPSLCEDPPDEDELLTLENGGT